jgi:hypothetical protein
MGNAKTIPYALELNDEALHIVHTLFQPIGMVVSVEKLNMRREGYRGYLVTLAGGTSIKVAVRSYENPYEEVGIAFEFVTDLPTKDSIEGRPGQWETTRQRGCEYQLHVWKPSGFAALVPITSIPALQQQAADLLDTGRRNVEYNKCLTKCLYSAYVKIPYDTFVAAPGVVAKYFRNPEGIIFDYVAMEGDISEATTA